MKPIEIKLERELKFVDGKSCAFTLKLNEYEKINGCEYYKLKVEENLQLENDLKDLKSQIMAKENLMLKNKKEMLDLESYGYCPIDYEQTKLVGKLTKTEVTHRLNCKHKE